MSQQTRPVPARLQEKISSIGGDQESGFEQAFATLAYSYISDKAPRLLDHMVGFQLVERNEDNTRAVGIFGFQLGEQWLYVPVFFLSGDLKGHELLYLKSQNQFVPLMENWVNYVMAKRPHVLGETESQSLNQLGVIQPDLRSLSIPPGQTKSSSTRVAIPEGTAEWAIPTLPWLYKTALTNPYAGVTEKRRVLLPRLMSESYVLCKLAMDVRRAYPDLAAAMDRYYGKEALRQAIVGLRDKVAAASKSPLLGDTAPTKAVDVDGTFSILHGFLPRKKTAFEKVSITVDTDKVITEGTKELTEEEQERLLRDGHLVEDHRNGDEVSVAYNTQIECSLTNPDCTSIYDVLVKPGDYARCLIISHPYSTEDRKQFCTVVRLDPRNWSNVHRSYIFVKPVTDNERETFNNWLEEQSSVTPKKTGRYVAICPDGTGTVPFEIREKVGDNRYRVWCETYGARRPRWLPALGKPEKPGWYEEDHYGDYIEIGTASGTKFRKSQGCLYVPADAKIIEVKAPKKPEKDDDECCNSPCVDTAEPGYGGESKNPPIEPGNIADIQLGLIQKMAALKIYANGGEISINRGPLTSTKQALFSLIVRHGFREKVAKQLLTNAQRARVRGTMAQCYVKYARGYPLVEEAPNAPAIPDAQYTVDQGYAPVPAQSPDHQLLGVDGMSASMTDPSVYDTRPEAMPDPMTMQHAQEAAQTGQREVFDTSMITGLLRTVRQDSLVERYMGDLLKALDRLGRMLFLFYWHNDQFAEQYGKSDIPELEDTLRNTFENLGDLTLFLKEKDVAPLPGAEMGEPQVDESAE